MTESDILYENGPFWIVRGKRGGFEVYQTGVTCSTRVATIGFEGQKGLERAKQETDKRAAQWK